MTIWLLMGAGLQAGIEFVGSADPQFLAVRTDPGLMDEGHLGAGDLLDLLLGGPVIDIDGTGGHIGDICLLVVLGPLDAADGRRLPASRQRSSTLTGSKT